MIELQFTGKCKEFKCADLELEEYKSFEYGKDWMVRCIHEAACCRMQDKAEDKE